MNMSSSGTGKAFGIYWLTLVLVSFGVGMILTMFVPEAANEYKADWFQPTWFQPTWFQPTIVSVAIIIIGMINFLIPKQRAWIVNYVNENTEWLTRLGER